MKKLLTSLGLIMALVVVPECAIQAQDLEPAKVYLYRPKSPVGMAVIYAVFIDDQQVGIARNGFTHLYEVSEPTSIEISGETEKRMTFDLDVKPGGKYYVKCGVKMGAMTGRPKFTLESSAKGEKTFNKLSGN